MEVGQEYETTKFTIRKILMKHIAVMTSGGDAPGMNACLRAVSYTHLTLPTTR